MDLRTKIYPVESAVEPEHGKSVDHPKWPLCYNLMKHGTIMYRRRTCKTEPAGLLFRETRDWIRNCKGRLIVTSVARFISLVDNNAAFLYVGSLHLGPVNPTAWHIYQLGCRLILAAVAHPYSTMESTSFLLRLSTFSDKVRKFYWLLRRQIWQDVKLLWLLNETILSSFWHAEGQHACWQKWPTPQSSP